MEAGSNNTKLNDRILWYDGDSTISETEVVRMLSLGLPVEGMFVENVSDEIHRYNQLVPPEQQIHVKQHVADLNFSWNIPEEYQTIDLVEYLHDKLSNRSNKLSDSEWNDRATRIASELSLYRRLGLETVLRTLIYIINTLHKNNIVWGVGRGSSVSSYVLYLIGVHDVDSVKYELEITDFLRTE